MRPVPIQGYVVGTPEVKEVGDKTVIKFSISAPARFKKDREDNTKKHYSFFECEYWPNDRIPGNIQKEIAKVVKGERLSFHAEPIQDRWEQDGNKRSKIVFHVDGFLDRLHHIGGTNSSPVESNDDRFEDDVPF